MAETEGEAIVDHPHQRPSVPLEIKFLVSPGGDHEIFLQPCTCPICLEFREGSDSLEDDGYSDEEDLLSSGYDRSFDLEDEFEAKVSFASGRRSATSSGRSNSKKKKPKPLNKKVHHRKVAADSARQENIREHVERKKSNAVITMTARASLESAPSSRHRLGLDEATYNLLMTMQHRELTPNDYDVLLRLDDSVKKATVDKKKLRVFPTRLYTEEDVKGGQNTCLVCHDEFEVGNEMRELPCGHLYHKECIDRWLTTSSEHCPADNLPVT